MLENVHVVYYNHPDDNQSGRSHHTRIKQFGPDLFAWIKTHCPDGVIIAVVDSQAVLPEHLIERLVSPLKDYKNINKTTSLTTHMTGLSPLAEMTEFAGNTLALDHAIFLLQKPGVFLTDVINPLAFAVRNGSYLDQEVSVFACNNVLVNPSNETLIKGPKPLDIGDQKPLPAHPLSELHWRLSEQSKGWSEASYPCLNDKPNVLHVMMDWGGGVAKWVDEFINSQTALNHFILVSEGEFFRQTQGERLKLYYHTTDGPAMAEFHLAKPIKATCVEHPEYQSILNQIITSWDIQAVLVSSLIGHSMDCLNTGLPTVRVLHDYFPHWPSLNAQLDVPVVDQKVLSEVLQSTSHEPFGLIDEAEFKAWQQSNNRLLKQPLVKVVAPDVSVVNNLLKLEHADCYQNTQIIPHGVAPLKSIKYHADAQPFQILVLGRITQPKGQALLQGCIEACSGDDSISFVLLGAGKAGQVFKHLPQVTVIEDFKHEELRAQVKHYSPQLALLTSITSETFSYTLSELQMLGIPVLATAVGAFVNRIEEGQTGFLTEPTVDAMTQRIQQLKNQRSLLTQVHNNSLKLKPESLKDNAQHYQQLLVGFNLKTSVYQTHGILRPEPLAQANQLTQRQLIKVQTRLTGVEVELQDKSDWAQQLSQQVTHLESNIAMERSEIKHLKSTIDDVQARYANEVKQLKHQVKDINEQLTTAVELNEQFRQENLGLQNQINEILNSRSWRLTQPLRKFTTYARHKRNAIRFRYNQMKGVPKRVKNSLKTRGLKDTTILALGKLKKPQTTAQTNEVHEVTENFVPITINTAKSPKVSVIIPVYNQYKHTYHCLESLSRLQDKTSFEVIVVDDCSTDDTATQLQKITGITAHTQAQNGGFIESCNTGAQLAKGEFLLFLNNDTEVLPNWLDSLVATFSQHPKAGLVGSQLIYPDGRLQEAGGIVFADASGWNYGRFDQPHLPEYQHLREVSYCSGASIIIKKQLFDDLGQFDRRYKPAYYEDTDLAFAVRAAGLKVFYQPQSKIIHFEGISSGTDLSSGTKKYQVINQQKFLDKWHSDLQKQPQAGTDIELARFQNRPKRVLILDACTPTPDQDSGSLRMINLIQIFNQLQYQVSFIPENMSHFDSYTLDLQQLGVECVYAPKYHSPIDYLEAKGQIFDLVILSRYYVAKPLMAGIRNYCPNAQLWFDTVDLHYLREQRMAEIAQDSSMIKAAAKTKTLELAVAQACDLTLVVSPYEQSVLAEESPELKVDVLSNIHEIYGNKKTFAQRHDIMFIGGYQHTPNVDGILWFVDSILPLITAELPEIKLHIVGSKAPQQVIDLGQQPNVVFHGFVEDIDPFMQDIRIAVAPLRFGAGVKGKVNMSMSHGQPVVGTKVAVEGMYTTHQKDVMMADSPQDFAAAVIQLYQDESLWNQLSAGGLENVHNWFSFAAAKAQIEKLLQ